MAATADNDRQRELLTRNTCPVGQWTVFREEAEDGVMSEGQAVTTTTQRRSGRRFLKMKVKAQGRAHNGKKFKEAAETVVVNAHGGLLLLQHEIDNGEMLVLTNPDTQEELECRVVYQGEPCERGQRIGVEFLTPAPRFWGVEFLEAPGASGDSAIH
jgi:hypothetical protein